MQFNCSKFYSMHITRDKFPVITTYFLNDQALERTDAHPCLRVLISSDLRLNNHCDFVVKRSFKTHNFISCNFYHCTRETEAKLSPSLVPLLWNMLVVLGIPTLSAIFQTLRKYSVGLLASFFETTFVT